MRIVLADDHALFRDGLRSLLEAHGADVLAEAKNGQEAIDLARELTPDIVLMDLDMPEVTGLEATRIIRAELPAVRVVVLTASEDDADVYEAVRCGASGYLPKNMEAAEFFGYLDAAVRGEPAMHPSLARKMLCDFDGSSAPAVEDGAEISLTEREREVLQLLVSGVTSNRELADRLFVSENTVKYHLRNILDKLHVKNRAQVIAYALSHKLVDPPRT